MPYGLESMQTDGGYVLTEVLSALQKCIRRGSERQAMYWAIEMESAYAKHLWNRLEVIVHEDIGLANPLSIPFIRTCKEQYWDMKDRKNGGYRLVLTNAIAMMCRSKKTRLADNLANVAYRTDEHYDIPDVALDKHTARGRKMKRGWTHFFDEGSKISNEAEGLDIYQDEAHDLMSRNKPMKYAKSKQSRQKIEEVVPYDSESPDGIDDRERSDSVQGTFQI
jgi:replication-associated recombination protein RarA